MLQPRAFFALLGGFVLTLAAAVSVAAADLKLVLPLGRQAYQTNETIDVAVIRASADAGELAVTLTGADGSRMAWAFATSRAAEHLHLNARLLRPGSYTLDVVDGAGTTPATTPLLIVSHVRRSTFKTINWGRATNDKQLLQGEDSLGFNHFYGAENGDNLLRAGVDAMGVCVMSGGHQMDLRMECDWSDPYVSRGGTQRVVRNAFQRRTAGNTPGVNFYDEPGLTWYTDPTTGETTPHGVPSQVRSFESAFDKAAPRYNEVNPQDPASAAAWQFWARWKLGFMDAAWKEAAFDVQRVRPDFLTASQSQYGWSAFADGYYFNVTRSLSVVSGHGGYHDWGPGYFNPSMTLEFSRARDYSRDNWYLPTWYGNTTDDQFRVEQYLSFITNMQGMMSPPDLEPSINASARQGIVETNLIFSRLGTVFCEMPVQRQPVALLYSMSCLLDMQTRDRSLNYSHGTPHGIHLSFAYLACVQSQLPINTVVDEDVIDGTLAAEHRAVIIAGIDYLDPEVVRGLEQFASQGGLVLTTASSVKIAGAVDLGVVSRMPDQDAIDALVKAKNYKELGPYTTTGKHLESAAPLAKALQAALAKAGIAPAFVSDAPGIVAGDQGEGEIDYLFAVNATYDAAAGTMNALAPATATLGFAADGRPVYDAIVGGIAPEFGTTAGTGGTLNGTLHFGPGQMRAFARTARPIGGVRVAAPMVRRDLTRQDMPIELDIAATLVDTTGATLSGVAPMQVRVIDPLGVTRYDLYRATRQGTLALALPLAANDPAGTWTVEVRDLLANTEGRASFTFAPLARPGLLAGTSRRAAFYADDAARVFAFARLHRRVTLVTGGPAYDAAAARLTSILAPWGVTCVTMPVADAAKSHALTDAEVVSWVGMDYASKGQIKAGDTNAPSISGFALEGPAILLGTPEDNALIGFLQKQKFLPYDAAAATFPGAGRGYVAWQLDGLGKGQESVTLIGYDAAGVSEAVGTFYEMVAGLDPLTPWAAGRTELATPATAAVNAHPALAVAWSTTLSDRVAALGVTGGALTVLTHDGSQTTLGPDGKATGTAIRLAADALATAVKALTVAPDAAVLKAQARPDRLAKLTAALPAADGNAASTAVVYWGGTLRLVGADGAIHSEQRLPQDITALAWLNPHLLVAGLADGRVLGLTVD